MADIFSGIRSRCFGFIFPTRRTPFRWIKILKLVQLLLKRGKFKFHFTLCTGDKQFFHGFLSEALDKRPVNILELWFNHLEQRHLDTHDEPRRELCLLMPRPVLICRFEKMQAGLQSIGTYFFTSDTAKNVPSL